MINKNKAEKNLIEVLNYLEGCTNILEQYGKDNNILEVIELVEDYAKDFFPLCQDDRNIIEILTDTITYFNLAFYQTEIPTEHEHNIGKLLEDANTFILSALVSKREKPAICIEK